MNLNSYQAKAVKFAAYKNREYPFLALAEEAGEVLGKLAKFVRKHEGSSGFAVAAAAVEASENHKKLREDLISELGDVLWDVANAANELDVSLADIAKKNLEKLGGRKERGTIVGEGDVR